MGHDGTAGPLGVCADGVGSWPDTVPHSRRNMTNCVSDLANNALDGAGSCNGAVAGCVCGVAAIVCDGTQCVACVVAGDAGGVLHVVGSCAGVGSNGMLYCCCGVVHCIRCGLAHTMHRVQDTPVWMNENVTKM